MFDSGPLREDFSRIEYDNCGWHAIRVSVDQSYDTTMCRIPVQVLTNYSIVAKVLLSQANSTVNLFNISSNDGSFLSVTLDNCDSKLVVDNRGVGCSAIVSHAFSLPYTLRSGTFYRFALEINPARIAFYFECVEVETFEVQLDCSLSTGCGHSKNTNIDVLGPGTSSNSRCATVSYSCNHHPDIYFINLPNRHLERI